MGVVCGVSVGFKRVSLVRHNYPFMMYGNDFGSPCSPLLYVLLKQEPAIQNFVHDVHLLNQGKKRTPYPGKPE